MMPRTTIAAGLLWVTLTGLSSGCSYSGRQGWEFHPVETLVDGLFDSAFGKRKSETDKLWEQGYGYNNPNADKYRREPVVVGAD